MQNLHKRGNVWYLRALVNGARISQSLDTGNQEEAGKRARALLREIRDGKWEEIKAEVQVRKTAHWATLGEILEVYRTTARSQELRTGSPRPATVAANIRMLRLVLGQEMDKLPVTEFSRATLGRYADGVLERGGKGELERDRARETAYSTLRQAKSVFATWAMEAYREAGLEIPDLSEVLSWSPVTKPPRKYQWPGDELVEETKAEAQKLKGSSLWPAWLLCHDLGMRAGEAEAANWDWIVHKDGAAYMEIRRRDGFAPKSRDHKVRIPAATLEALMACRTEDPYILPGGTTTARHNLVQRELADWMRANGWDAHRFPKAAHELRKLAGSRWYTRHGLEVAAEWLGDNPDTVFKYYADLERHPDPDAGLGAKVGVA